MTLQLQTYSYPLYPQQMNQNFEFTFMFHFFPSPSVCTFILFLLSRAVLATVDPYYVACSQPKTCGDGQSISFPFYIQGQQESSCGYPGFNLSCNSKRNPVLNLHNSNYIIRQIFYSNQSLRVSDAAVSETINVDVPCLNLPRNRTQRLSLPEDRFALVSTQTELLLLYNCSSSLPGKLLQYKAGKCEDNNKTRTVLALFKGDPNLKNAFKECGGRVETLVDMYGGDSGGLGIEEVIRRGFLLNWTASNCSVCEESGGKCGFNASTYHFKCFCPDRPHAVQCQPLRKVNGLIKKVAVAAVTATAIGMLIFLAFCFRRKLSLNNCLVFWKKKTKNYQNIEVFLRSYGALAPRRYSYLQVKKMTNSFKHKLGQGGYGDVYKGSLCDGRNVAVKVLNESNSDGEEFINEVASISQTSHVNIVTLLGFCFEGHRRALIYKYMANGSLEKFIYEKTQSNPNQKLKWEILYQIAVGIATGLEYLHYGCNTRILHLDIKPQNILLDEDFCPKISDFGLAKICPRKESIISMTGALGTIGYIAPEVFSRYFGEVSHKADVYSYGMMVLEMVGGRENDNVMVEHTSEIYFPHWINNHLESDDELRLKGLASEVDEECTRKMIIVSLWCIQTNPSDRPAMSRVVEMLEGSLSSLQIPPKPFLTSPLSPARDSSAPVLS